ncbi:MAG: DoxX family protein [Acidobacteria bacterium]|nr:DoxX family protein [Acidobacteriota bacterium]
MSESGITENLASTDQPRPVEDLERTEHSLLSSIGLLILRVGIGGFMASHGWGKFQMVMAGDLDKFGDPIGIGSAASLLLIVSAEFVCALLVVIGAATRIAAIFPVIGMAVAAFIVHGGDPWTMGEGARLFFSGASESWASKEAPLLFLIPFLALVFTGAGRFSVDALVRSRWQSRRQQAG